jgi:hypothetical protein
VGHDRDRPPKPKTYAVFRPDFFTPATLHLPSGTFNRKTVAMVAALTLKPSSRLTPIMIDAGFR